MYSTYCLPDARMIFNLVTMVVSSITPKTFALESSSHLRLMTQAKTLPLMTLTMTWQRFGSMTSFHYILKIDDLDHNIHSRVQLNDD